MKNANLIDILSKLPKDADVSLSYYDFYGEQECAPQVTYNEYTNNIYIVPGDDESED